MEIYLVISPNDYTNADVQIAFSEKEAKDLRKEMGLDNRDGTYYIRIQKEVI